MMRSGDHPLIENQPESATRTQQRRHHRNGEPQQENATSDATENSHSPSKEGSDGKGRVERRVGIGTGGGVDLASAAETVEGVEEAGTHEADEAEEDDLGVGVCVDGFEGSESGAGLE